MEQNTEKKLNIYQIIGIVVSAIYLIFTLLNYESYENIYDYIIMIAMSPIILMILWGIGEIVNLLKSIDEKLSFATTEEVSSEVEDDEDTEEEEENFDEDEEEDAIEEDDDDDLDEDNDDEEEENEEENDEEEAEEKEFKKPEVVGNKRKCPNCGHLNNLKRSYCFVCATKLKEGK